MSLSGDPQYPSPYEWVPTPPPAPSRPRPVVSDPVTGWVLLVLGLVVLVGSFSEWASIDIGDGTPVDGTDGDGGVTLVLGIVVAVLGLLVGLRLGRLWAAAGSLVLSTLVALTALLDVGKLSGDTPVDGSSLTGNEVSISWGLWTVLIGGVLAAVVSGVGLLRRR